MSLEPPLPHTDADGSKCRDIEKLENSDGLIFSPAEREAEAPQRSVLNRYGRVLLGVGIFAALSGGILLVTSHIKPANSMAGMEGHDMSGMSHGDMMRVDGAFNPVPVTVEVIQPDEFEAAVTYTGSVEPYEEVTVYPRVAGQLTNYSVYPGDRIEAGQLLARLDASELSTELAEARADAAVMETSVRVSEVALDEQTMEITRLDAELNYLRLQENRFATLVEEGVISQDEYDLVASEMAAKQALLERAQSTIERLQAEVERERAMLLRAQSQANTAAVMESYTVLQSPISGIVQDRMVDPGVVVQPSMGVLKIGDYSQVRLQANVAQRDAAFIRVGTPIQAQIPGASGDLLTGEITSIFPQTNNNTRTVKVEALIDNPQEQLLSGQFLEMTIVTGRSEDSVSVPQMAVVDFNGEQSVWVVEDEMAQRRAVETSMVNGERVEVTSGLNPGDRVITSGYSRLVPNAPVAMVDRAGTPVPTLGSGSQSDIEIAIISPDPARELKQGSAELTLEVRDPNTQDLLAVEDIVVDITMPMPNMAPMTTMVELQPDEQPGRFHINTHFGMAGNWQIKVEVNEPNYSGQAQMMVPVE